ncbi:MAG: 50S ribosomal protein L13 [Cytophagales bacterium]|nr:50S ribosomal protein L13 [Cytophagales bacterium]
MDAQSYKTKFVSHTQVQKNWVLVDANEAILGRLSSQVAKILRGKNKPSFTPHVDCGDNVIVINAEKVQLSGNKWTDRNHLRYTGYPGGQRSATPIEIMQKNPKKLVEMAVKRMLPKNRLGRKIYTNLYVYEGGSHPHDAQKPLNVKL